MGNEFVSFKFIGNCQFKSFLNLHAVCPEMSVNPKSVIVNVIGIQFRQGAFGNTAEKYDDTSFFAMKID